MDSILFKDTSILLSCGSSFELLNDVNVGIENGIIAFIDSSLPEKRYTHQMSLKNKVLLPGFVNSHVHTLGLALRDVSCEWPMQKYVEEYLSDADAVACLNLSVCDFLRNGIVSFSDFSLHSDKCFPSLCGSGIKANTTCVFEGGNELTNYEKFGTRVNALNLRNRVRNHCNQRIIWNWAVRNIPETADNISDKWRAEISALGGNLRIELPKIRKEYDRVLCRKRMSPIAYYEKHGYLDSFSSVVNLDFVSKEDYGILKAHDCSLIVTPQDKPFCNEFGELLIGLGSGYITRGKPDMFALMKQTMKRYGYSGEQVFKMATENGALIQGRRDSGRLELGKRADLIAVNLKDKVSCPDEIIEQADDVYLTMVDGNILYLNGVVLSMDYSSCLNAFEICKSHLKNIISRLN